MLLNIFALLYTHTNSVAPSQYRNYLKLKLLGCANVFKQQTQKQNAGAPHPACGLSDIQQYWSDKGVGTQDENLASY